MTRRQLFARALGAIGAAALAPLAKLLPACEAAALEVDAIAADFLRPIRGFKDSLDDAFREAWRKGPPPEIGDFVRLRTSREAGLGQHPLVAALMLDMNAGICRVAGFSEGAAGVTLELHTPNSYTLESLDGKSKLPGQIGVFTLSAPSWGQMEKLVDFGSHLRAKPPAFA